MVRKDQGKNSAPSKPSARKMKQTEKAKSQKPKKTKQTQKKKDDASSEDSKPNELEPPATGKTKLEVDWKDPELSLKLVALIMENKSIKQSLYPPCGPNASTTNGGGKPKTNAQWELCLLLLGDMEKYKDTLAAVKTPKEKLSWGNKLKNRMRMMAKITRAFDKEMGQTGAGIVNAAEIDMSVTNSFTTKWAEISDSCPWFFDMWNLIAQRPNLVPTGLGHSSTGINAGVIMPGPTAAEGDETGQGGEQDDEGTSSTPFKDWERTPCHTPEPEMHKCSFSEIDDEAAAGSGNDYEPSSPITSEMGLLDDEAETGEAKIKAKDKETDRRNPAKPSTSTPAAPVPAVTPKASKKTKIAEFSEIAKDEEKTRQKELELATLWTRQAIKATEVKGRLVEKREDRRREAQQAKQEERMMKLRMKELKMRNTHELRMAGRATSSASHAASFFDSHSSSGSHCTPSEPPDYTEFNGFHGNVVAGPSTSTSNVDFSLSSDSADIAEFNAFANSLPGNHFIGSS
ncbi:hypothetical protein B0H10DRAFT_2220394 [Mycena sp. CBHHK59/15]|nr:hypothetical protein B0H10DRAFT_2220394 [Mycena sp. CBHHK59/15]